MPSKRPSEDPEEDDRKPAAKRVEKEPEDDAQSVTQDEPNIETAVNRKISMIFPLVSCGSCVNIPSSS